MEGLLPPQAIEAEKSVLGAMLLDKQAICDVIQILNPDDFYEPRHIKLCEKIYSMYNDHKAVDIITIGEDLPYMVELTNIVPTVANVKTYAGTVKGKAIRRQYIHAAEEVKIMAYQGEYENITTFKSDVLAKLDFEINAGKKSKNHIKEVLADTLDKIEKRYNDLGETKKYGLKWIDEKTGGAHDTDLTILAARPSVGKTAFSIQIAKNISQKNNVAIFNLEMSKEQLVERMLSAAGRINSQKIRFARGLADSDWDKISKATVEIGNYNMYIFDDLFKVEEIRAACRDLKNREQLDFVLVDYLQLCDTLKKTTGNNEKISYISRQFKLMAKEFRVPFWVLSQLSRSNEQENRWPKLTDLRDSGSIEQDADSVFFLYDSNYGKYEATIGDVNVSDINFIIGKQRNGERDIYTSLKFYKGTQTFYDN